MTLALYGKCRRRRGILILAALLAVTIGVLGGARLDHGRDALAANTGFLPATATHGPNEWDQPSNGLSSDNV